MNLDQKTAPDDASKAQVSLQAFELSLLPMLSAGNRTDGALLPAGGNSVCFLNRTLAKNIAQITHLPGYLSIECEPRNADIEVLLCTKAAPSDGDLLVSSGRRTQLNAPSLLSSIQAIAISARVDVLLTKLVLRFNFDPAAERESSVSSHFSKTQFVSPPGAEPPVSAVLVPQEAEHLNTEPSQAEGTDKIGEELLLELELNSFALPLGKAVGVSIDLINNKLLVEKDKHEYVWINGLEDLMKKLQRVLGHNVRLTVSAVVRNQANIEAFLGCKLSSGWKNFGARPGYPVTTRIEGKFSEVRIGLRLAGRGSIENLKLKVEVIRELEAKSRIELRRSGGLGEADLRIGVIGDPFTLGNFEGVIDTLPIQPHNWRILLSLFPVDFLFVESAWVGNDGSWANRIVNNIEELASLVDWCKGAGVPTVFWNKEDPVHFSRFIKAAKLFDLVYTTCEESISSYMSAGVSAKLLPFSVNTRTYNPIGSGSPREKCGVFAGAYYGSKYPERSSDMERIFDIVSEHGLRIFDRSAGSTSSEFAFPDRYKQYIVGSATSRELDVEYKKARIAINVNTVKDSGSMFARRVFELAATGTPTVSNYSLGIERMFEGQIVASDDPAVLSAEVTRLFQDDEHWAHRRRALMRITLLKHTIRDRVETIMSDLGVPSENISPKTFVLLQGGGGSSMPATKIESHDRSTPIWKLVPSDTKYEYVLLQMRGALADKATIREFIRHQEYSSADVVGEAQGGEPFRYGVPLRRSLFLARYESLVRSNLSLNDFLASNFTAQSTAMGLKIFGIVRLQADGASTCLHLPQRFDDEVRLSGWWSDSRALSVAEAPAGCVYAEVHDDVPVYARVGERHKLGDLPKTSFLDLANGKDGLAFGFECEIVEGHVEAQLHVFFYSDSERLGVRIVSQNTYGYVRPPTGWTRISIAVRAKGKGKLRFNVSHDTKIAKATDFVNQCLDGLGGSGSAWLCISSVYPRPDNLYRNAFVHTRAKAYQDAGKQLAVTSMAGNEDTLTYYEFDGIPVFAGGALGLEDVLRARPWGRIACHMVSPAMVGALEAHAAAIPKVVWIHGIESERWYRRAWEIDITGPDLYKRIKELISLSDDRTKALGRVYQRSCDSDSNYRMVFVSDWFRKFVATIDTRPPPQNYRIIPNPIDTRLFSFVQKGPEDRLRWLSIRPYASRKYANDLTVAAILLLSKEPWFENVAITLVGRGALFDDTVEPLRRFPNVVLEHKFLTGAEIKRYHARHGIFLSPTRFDSQGVSFCEAMASGLVPVTNDCSSIPEFLERETGLMAPPDDPAELALRIKRLVDEPDLFCALSARVARNIRTICSLDHVIESEIDAIEDFG